MDEKKSRVVSPAFFIVNRLNINAMRCASSGLGVIMETLAASHHDAGVQNYLAPSTTRSATWRR